MRLLLDENFPVDLVQEFVGHECAHVVSMGWQGTKNGALLAKAEEAGFHVLITLDTGIPKQNDMGSRQLAVYVLQPEGQGPSAVRALVGDVLAALDSFEQGQVVVLSNRTRKRTQ